jgi:hypothetical protein
MRILFLLLGAAGLALAWYVATVFSRDDPWYNHTDDGFPTIVNALALNSGVPPGTGGRPELTTTYLLALDLRLRHFLGGLPVWNLRRLDAQVDPVRAMSGLIGILRTHNRILLLGCLVASGMLAWTVSRTIEGVGLALALMAGCSGLVLQAILGRAELLCLATGSILGAACLWRAAECSGSRRLHWLMLAGFLGAGATFTLAYGVWYLVSSYAWCWITALLRRTDGTREAGRQQGTDYWQNISPAVTAAAVLVLLHLLVQLDEQVNATAILRLRLAALLAALLPLLRPAEGRTITGRFLRSRGLDLAYLLAGAMGAILAAWFLLRLVLPAEQARQATLRVLSQLGDPTGGLPDLPAATPARVRGLLHQLGAAPFLPLATLAFSTLAWRRQGEGMIRAVLLLLLANGLGPAFLAAGSLHHPAHGLYFQASFLLACVVALGALGIWEPRGPAERSWAAPLIFTGAAVLLVTVPLRLRPLADSCQTESTPPLAQTTVTCLYEHRYHPDAYSKLMLRHYHGRGDFIRALETYLADPAHRRAVPEGQP